MKHDGQQGNDDAPTTSPGESEYDSNQTENDDERE
jgi:hypothetical protein